MTFKDLFYNKTITEKGCWVYTETKQLTYLRISDNGHIIYAHRAAFKELAGALSDTLDTAHKCHTPGCFNPFHLKSLSHRENCHEGPKHLANITHCIYGHPFNEANTRYVKRKNYTQRVCKQCDNLRHKLARGTLKGDS